MPRLFPTFHRSRDHPQGDHYPDSGYNEYHYQQHHPSSGTTWRKILSRRPREDGRWEEEFVERPSGSFSPYDAPGYIRSRERPAAEDYHHAPGSTDTRTEETFDELNSNPPPIVQRENSFSRLQEAFADRGPTSRPVTDITLPTEGQRYTRTDMQTPTETHGSFASSNHPVVVNNTGFESLQPEYGHVPSPRQDFERSRHTHKDYPERHIRGNDSYGRHAVGREDYRFDQSSSSGSYYSSEEEEYPPYVLVVAPGHHGKKDTYYVVPGGAPVIFEDENGNELTRVGDFSGRYRPRPQRPVIIQDEFGNEIYRMGFDGRDSYDSGSESDDMYYNASGHRKHRDVGHHHSRDRIAYDGGSHHGSSRHAERGRGRYDDRYDDYRSHSTSSRTRNTPNVIYVEPSVNGGNSGHDSIRSSGRSSHRHHERHREGERGRSYGSPVINLDEVRRQTPGAGSPASSGARSYHSSSSRSHHTSRR